jgi:histidinol-phosphate aminotransferase
MQDFIRKYNLFFTGLLLRRCLFPPKIVDCILRFFFTLLAFMRPLSSLVRPHILSLQPYSSARSEYPVADDNAKNASTNNAPSTSATVFLDANENSLGAPPTAQTTAQTKDRAVLLHRYPDPLQTALKRRIAEIKGVPDIRSIFVGNGSDEPIDLLIRALCEPSVPNAEGGTLAGDSIVIAPPTYGMYEVSANIHNVRVRRAPLRRCDNERTGAFLLDADAVLRAADARTKIIILCSPNNPTAAALDAEAIERVLTGFDGVVLLDEAYIDFAPEKSFLPRLAEFPNLMIIQTFSKAWGMAALRLGMAFAAPPIIDVLNAIKSPYNVNIVSQEIALAALQNPEWKDRAVAELVGERERLRAALYSLANVRRVFPSDANFLLVEFDRARAVYAALVKRNIVVRDRSSVELCDNCLRITVGAPAENQRLLSALAEINSARTDAS